jgi:uncharacterized protein (TIGR02996 family)
MTEDAFLEDIIENPDDDAPRLVFADWLDDNGDPERAEFIRLQCALAGSPDDPGRSRWLARETELRQKHGKTWAGPVARVADEYHFRRGFVESVRLPVARVVSKAKELFARQPLRMVAAHLAPAADIKKFAQLPEARRLAVLNISSSMRAAGFRALIESPNLAGLLGLAVHDSPIGSAGLKALLDAPLLERLTHLDLSATGIGPDGVVELADSPRTRSLVALNLRGLGLTGETLNLLDSSEYLKRVRRLGLWYNHLGDDGLEWFVQTPLFARLRSLDLGYNRLTARGARALAEAPALIGLRSLWLGVDQLGDEGVLALARSPHLHPEAVVAIWFHDWLSEETKREAVRLLGERVQFDRSLGLPETDPPVGWPLWRPE